jgi:hypothetical protein
MRMEMLALLRNHHIHPHRVRVQLFAFVTGYEVTINITLLPSSTSPACSDRLCPPHTEKEPQSSKRWLLHLLYHLFIQPVKLLLRGYSHAL